MYENFAFEKRARAVTGYHFPCDNASICDVLDSRNWRACGKIPTHGKETGREGNRRAINGPERGTGFPAVTRRYCAAKEVLADRCFDRVCAGALSRASADLVWATAWAATSAYIIEPSAEKTMCRRSYRVGTLDQAGNADSWAAVYLREGCFEGVSEKRPSLHPFRKKIWGI